MTLLQNHQQQLNGNKNKQIEPVLCRTSLGTVRTGSY